MKFDKRWLKWLVPAALYLAFAIWMRIRYDKGQHWLIPWWQIAYLLSPMFRMRAEVRAYAVQAKLEGLPVRVYEKTIRDGYCLSEKAKAELKILLKGGLA